MGFLSGFFTEMGNMGVELFGLGWVRSIVLFFSLLAWALYVTGLVVSGFEVGVAAMSGRSDIKTVALNAGKGLLAVMLFTTVPVRLYELSVTLQSQLMSGITGYNSGNLQELALEALEIFSSSMEGAAEIAFGQVSSPFVMLLAVIMMAYAVIKVFCANLKRGGILLIQIAVGSLHMFSIPRGYTDGFWQWCKQIVGLCLTAFLQTTILTAGLMILNSDILLGLGLMLSAGEVPRIAGAFGLDTSTRANITGAVHAAQAAITTTRTIVQAVS